MEESAVLREWNQCLSLIRFDDSLPPEGERGEPADDEDVMLEELDGVLPWPSKSRRR